MRGNKVNSQPHQNGQPPTHTPLRDPLVVSFVLRMMLMMGLEVGGEVVSVLSVESRLRWWLFLE